MKTIKNQMWRLRDTGPNYFWKIYMKNTYVMLTNTAQAICQEILCNFYQNFSTQEAGVLFGNIAFSLYS